MYERIANAFRAYLRLSSRHPWLVLLVWLLVSGGVFWIGSSLKVRGDLEDLFPEDTPAVIRAKETRRILGNTQELRLLIGSPDRELNRKVAARVAAFFEARKVEQRGTEGAEGHDIARVEWKRDVSFFEKNGLLFVGLSDLQELERQVGEAIQKAVKKDLELDDFALDDDDKKPAEAKAGDAKPGESKLPTVEEVKKKYKVEGFREYFEASDGSVIAVKAFPAFKPSDATRTQALNDAVDAEMKRILADYPGSGLEYVMDGDYSQVTKAAKQIMKDAAASGIWSLLGIGLVVIAFFRRVRALIVVVVVLAVTMSWVLGFAELAVGYLNLVTSIIFAILFGMGVDYLIHGMGRVDEEHHGGVSLEDAVERGLIALGRPVFNAMATTAVTLFALMFFDFRGFSQLGLIAGFGVVFALIAFYFVYPPLAFAMNRVWPQRTSKAHLTEVHEHGIQPLPPVPKARGPIAWTIVGLSVAIGLGLGVVAMDLHFDADMGRFRVKDNAAENSLKAKYKTAESRSASPALVVTKDIEETRRLHRYLEGAVAEAKAHPETARYPRLQEVSSVWSFVPADQAAKLAIIAEVKRKIDNKYGALEGQAKTDADELLRYLTPATFGPDDLPPWIKEKFTDTEGRFGRYVLLDTRGSKADALTALDIQSQIGTITVPATATEPELTLTSAATFYISGEAYSVVKREGPLAAIIGFFVVLIVVLFDTRKIKNLLMIVSPVIFGFAITLGVMTIFDVPLDLFNVVVLPQIFGIGIDTGTHLMHRLEEGGPRVVKNMVATGAAAGISSLLTAVGFAALLPVQNEGLRSIGIVAVLGVSISFVINAVMFIGFLWIKSPKKVA